MKEQGVTILELLVVLLVIALVMAVTYPALSRSSASLHLRSCSRDVINVFRYARERAVTEQTGMMVTVDKEKQELILSNSIGDGARTYTLPRDVRIYRAALAGNEVLNGPLIVRYLPNGSSDRAELLLKSDSGALIEIGTDPITGGARLESDHGADFR